MLVIPFMLDLIIFEISFCLFVLFTFPFEICNYFFYLFVRDVFGFNFAIDALHLRLYSH